MKERRQLYVLQFFKIIRVNSNVENAKASESSANTSRQRASEHFQDENILGTHVALFRMK
jgi:hypothetical protein